MSYINDLMNQVGNTASGSIAGSLGASLGDYASRGLDSIFGIDRKKEQVEQQKKLTDVQSKANKELMLYGNELQKDMFNYTSPSKRVQQLKDAGLSVGLMYGMGGQGGSTVGNSASGSVGGSQASSESEMKQVNIQQQGMALQMQKLASEIEVNKSIANKNNTDANYTGGAQTNLTEEQINLAKQNVKLAFEQTDLTKIDAEYEVAYKRALIDNIVSQKNANIANEENLKQSVKIGIENIDKIKQEIENLKSQKNLNDEETQRVKQMVVESMAKISLMDIQKRETLANANETEMNNILLKDVTEKFGGDKLKIAGLAMPLISTIVKALLVKK